MSKISKNIKKFRNACGMTQEDLATKIHVTRQTVSSWETDRTQPDLQILQALAGAFGIEIEELIYGKRKNNAVQKEKLLFGNTLVTVLSVIGCLLIGAGVVMIFIKYWQDFPTLLKLATCFIPALLGQGVGIFAYIKKKESLPWCEGVSVLWMLGTGVTTGVLFSQLNYNIVSDEWMFLFLAVSFFALMLIFRTLAPLAVVHTCGILWFIMSLDTMRLYDVHRDSGASDIIKFSVAVIFQALFIAAVYYASSRLYKKESNIIRYTFSQWINFAAAVAFTVFAFGRTRIDDAAIPVAVIACIICFLIGQRHEGFVSPYKFFGTVGSAAAFCFFSIASASVVYGDIKACVIILLACSLLPLILIFAFEKTRLQNLYLRAYMGLLTFALFNFNLAGILTLFRRQLSESQAYDLLGTLREALFVVNFLVGVAGFIMLIVYGAKERKLIYLNLGFILCCVSVIAKLYLLDLGLIVTGLLLIVCGAGLLFINLKISQLRQKEKTAYLEQGEEEE